MKKYCITLIIFLSIILTSCEMMYFTTNKTSHIELKQTIKTFEHLKEPIVITMPVYKNKHLFGNKNFAELLEMLGHIFVVIDIETDSVYDWVYFPCEVYTNWRCSEIGTNPTIYCSAGAYGGPIGCLNPTNVGKRTFDTVQYFSCAYSAKNKVPFAESVVSCSSEFSTPPFAKIIGIP